MRAVPAVRRMRVERRLFEAHARLAAAREELEVLTDQHDRLREVAEAAYRRVLVAETALAQGEWDDARRQVGAMAASLAIARARVAQLEAARDELLDELLAPDG